MTRVIRRDGRWLFVFPDGSRGPSLGLNSVEWSGAADRTATAALMRSANFNTQGAWSEDVPADPTMWQTPEIGFLGSFADIMGVPNKTAAEIALIDHPKFPAHCQARAASRCQPSPTVIGYFTDNERDWKDGKPGPAACIRRYFDIVVPAIRAVNPDALIFGPRLHRPSWGLTFLIGAFGDYCDLLPVNYYGVDAPKADQVARWNELNGLPVLVTEYYAKADGGCVDGFHPTNETGAGKHVSTQHQRAVFARDFLKGCADNPLIIGAHWFRHHDREEDGGTNCGVVGIHGTPYVDLLDQLKVSHRNWKALY